MATETIPQKKAKKGIFRWGAIIPFAIICLLSGIYFHFFFDGQLRRAIEWAGYKALGAEVNIADLHTSFFDASINIRSIELTDSEKPTQDSVKIGDIRFGMLWDALLRMKFVINEAAIEQIEFGVKRKTPGKVAPPRRFRTSQGFFPLKAANLNQMHKKNSKHVTEIMSSVI